MYKLHSGQGIVNAGDKDLSLLKDENNDILLVSGGAPNRRCVQIFACKQSLLHWAVWPECACTRVLCNVVCMLDMCSLPAGVSMLQCADKVYSTTQLKAPAFCSLRHTGDVHGGLPFKSLASCLKLLYWRIPCCIMVQVHFTLSSC